MWVEGTPTVLIESGKILEDNLKKNNLTMDSLNQLLRQKDIFDLNEVEHVLLEINGKISVMKKKRIQKYYPERFEKRDKWCPTVSHRAYGWRGIAWKF